MLMQSLDGVINLFNMANLLGSVIGLSVGVAITERLVGNRKKKKKTKLEKEIEGMMRN